MFKPSHGSKGRSGRPHKGGAGGLPTRKDGGSRSNVICTSVLKEPEANFTKPVQEIPQDLSFIVRIQPLRPDLNVQSIQTMQHGWWMPPTRRNAYIRDEPVPLFRWSAGNMHVINHNSPQNLYNNQNLHSAATVFTQMPDTPHLLAVNYDAQSVDVDTQQVGWRQLSFDFKHVPNTPMTRSYVTTFGEYGQIASPGSPHWMPQLLPKIYNFHSHDVNGHPIPSTRMQGGLVGSLPLLIALAVFSAPRDALIPVLVARLHPSAWEPHEFQDPQGREFRQPQVIHSTKKLIRPDEQHRGVVVSIYLDDSNVNGSTIDLLNRLQDGEFGPFFGP